MRRKLEMKFSEQLKKFRKSNRLSQEELSKAIYVSRQSVSNWENNKSYPDIHNLITLSILFDTTLDVLVKGEMEEIKSVRDIQNYQAIIKITNLFILLGIALMIIGRSVFGELFSVLIGFGLLLLLIVRRKKLKGIENKHHIPSYLFDLRTAEDILFLLENPGIHLEELTKKRNRIQVNRWLIWLKNIFLFLFFVLIVSMLSKKI